MIHTVVERAIVRNGMHDVCKTNWNRFRLPYIIATPLQAVSVCLYGCVCVCYDDMR